MEKWYVSTKKADFLQIAEEFHIDVVVARILRNRELIETEDIRRFLCGTKDDLYDGFLLKDMEKGVDFIKDCIGKKVHIRVIGDYDADGICATYILAAGLRYVGAIADTAIPHRVKDGYGLSEQLILDAKEDGIEVIITCDNGISAEKQIAFAYSLGIQLIVTDHHEVPKEGIPEAYAVIDPKQPGCEYPYKDICGAVVAYKFVECLFCSMKKEKEQDLKALEEMLQFTAIATICDVMPLVDENRILVKEGLKILKENPNIGLKALMDVCEIEKEKLNTYHLGFVIGPCINATGRLDTPKRALKLLQCANRKEAMEIASELKELNDSRKSMTVKGVENAVEWLNQEKRAQDKVLVVLLNDCHESLAGIIAGKIREMVYKPVFVLTQTDEGVIKGSGRSIDNYDMYEAIAECGDCFLKYGGHKMAAGLSMNPEKVEEFRRRVNENCNLCEEDLIEKVHIDVPMPLSYANLQLAKQLEKLEPFGIGNEKPLFAEKNLLFLNGRQMGNNNRAARYTVREHTGEIQQLLYFGDLQRFHDFLKEKFGEDAVQKLYTSKAEGFEISVTYQLGINHYRGKDELQCVMKNFC